MNVPKLRFNEFNDEWILTTLGDSSTFKQGIQVDVNQQKNYPFENSIRFIRIVDYTQNTNDIRFIEKQKNMNLVDKDDIVIVRYGATAGYVGRGIIGVIANNMFTVTPNDNVSKNFLYTILKQDKIYSKLNSSNGSSAMPALNFSSVAILKYSYPSIKEQEKLANFMDLLDKKIELQSKKIEALKLYKKGLIELIIKQLKVTKIPLKELLTETNEKTNVNNQYDVISSTAKGLFLQKEYFNKQQASENNIGYKILKKDQLVLSPQNLWMGNINLNTKYNIGIVSPSYKIYDINAKKVDINYFNYWIKTPRALYQYLISSEQGASIVRRNLNLDLFYEITIDLPTKLEQLKVGNFIKLFNEKTLLEEKYLTMLNALKKGLMQNMFV